MARKKRMIFLSFVEFDQVNQNIETEVPPQVLPSKSGSYFCPMNKRSSLFAFLLSAFILAGVTLAFPRYLKPFTEATLAWDVSGYYLYLPAIFIYKDLKKLEFLPGIIEKYKPSTTPDQAYDGDHGNKLMKYPAGMAVAYAPFFFLAHALAPALGFPADGFSLPYQVAIHLGSLLVGLLGLWFLRKNLLHFFSDNTTALAILLLVPGTNFFNYATFDTAMPHLYGFTLLAMLVHLTIRWHERPTWANSLGIGACSGLAALIRPTDIVFAMVPVLWGLTTTGWRQRLHLFWQQKNKLLLAATAVFLIGCIQLVYWKTTAGEWLKYSYRDQGFTFSRPHFGNVFFSYRKGWFIYTPLMLFAVAGFYFLAKRHWKLFPTIFLFFFVNTWIVSSWNVWWYGGGFGQRGFIQSYALLAFPLAAFLAWMVEKRWSKWVFTPLLLFCLALNLFQTRQAHFGTFETEMMSKAFYWRIFAKTKDNPYDRLLLDTNEGFQGEKKNIRLIYSTDYEQESDTSALSRQFARSGSFSVFVDSARLLSHAVTTPVTPNLTPGKWLHVSAWFYTPQKEWSDWWMPQMVVSFEQQGKPVHERIIRPCRVLNNHEWKEAWMDIRVPKMPFDRIRVFLRNPRNLVPMFMDDLRVEVFEGA
jgi:hypothetical protein